MLCLSVLLMEVILWNELWVFQREFLWLLTVFLTSLLLLYTTHRSLVFSY